VPPSSVGLSGSSNKVGKTEVPAEGGGMGESLLGAARLRMPNRSMLVIADASLNYSPTLGPTRPSGHGRKLPTFGLSSKGRATTATAGGNTESQNVSLWPTAIVKNYWPKGHNEGRRRRRRRRRPSGRLAKESRRGNGPCWSVARADQRGRFSFSLLFSFFEGALAAKEQSRRGVGPPTTFP
jgi:hypothetical protein